MCKEGVLTFNAGDLVGRLDGDQARRCGLVLLVRDAEGSTVLWLNGLFKGCRFHEPNKTLVKLKVESE